MLTNRSYRRRVAPALVLCALLPAGVPTAAASQQVTPYHPDRVTADTYARAERFLSDATDPLVFGASVEPTWVDGDRFWYRNDIPEGDGVRAGRSRPEDAGARVRPPGRSRGRCRRSMDTTIAPFALPFTSFDYVDGGIHFDVGERSFTCDLPVTRCTRRSEERATRPRLRALAGRDEGGVPAGPQPVGARRRHRRARRSSPRTGSRASGTPRTTPGGGRATRPWCCGLPTRGRSRRSSRTSAASGTCTW